MSTEKAGFEQTLTADALLRRGLLRGCYPLEHDDEGAFLWTRGEFGLSLSTTAGFLRLSFAFRPTEGHMIVNCEGRVLEEVSLRRGRQDCSLRLPQYPTELEISVDPVAFPAGDERALGLMLRSITLFDDEERHNRIQTVSSNALLNDREYRCGATVLASRPPHLRINLETRCNIPETRQACAYCAWDWAKEMELGSPPFRLDTVDRLGAFYRDAGQIGDCSIGEPTMNREFPEILARFDRDAKPCSLTSNGQLLGERRRRDLLGKNVTVYVSLDSATAEGFRRYRNDSFETIIANLRSLCAEKRRHGGLPTVFASFIAMRSNRHEVPAYLDLMKDVGVDVVKFRTLYLDDNVPPVVINNNISFDYAAEILSIDELRDLSPDIRRAAENCGIKVYVEWDEFEPAEKHDQGIPLCSEPWKTIYVLNRGMMPCCYGVKPLATWREQGERPLDQFLQDTFNSPDYQQIRAELASGRLAGYCRQSPSCPIVKRLAQSGPVPGVGEPR